MMDEETFKGICSSLLDDEHGVSYISSDRLSDVAKDLFNKSIEDIIGSSVSYSDGRFWKSNSRVRLDARTMISRS